MKLVRMAEKSKIKEHIPSFFQKSALNRKKQSPHQFTSQINLQYICIASGRIKPIILRTPIISEMLVTLGLNTLSRTYIKVDSVRCAIL